MSVTLLQLNQIIKIAFPEKSSQSIQIELQTRNRIKLD